MSLPERRGACSSLLIYPSRPPFRLLCHGLLYASFCLNLLDISLRLDFVLRESQPDFLRFFECLVVRNFVGENSVSQPDGSHSVCRRAVQQDRLLFLIAKHLQRLVKNFVFERVGSGEWQIVILQPQLLQHALLIKTQLAGSPQVDDGLDAIFLCNGEVVG